MSLDIPLDPITLSYLDTPNEVIRPQSLAFDTHLEMCTLTFPQPLKPGRATLYLEFMAPINRGLTGFYLSTYKDAKGEEQYIAVTQFEPSSARRAFPCWDEPEAKAVFKLTLTVDAKYEVLSNTMEARKEEKEGNRTLHEFEDTPLMSTYLMAYVVGNLDHIDDYTKKGVLVRVFTRPGNTETGKLALKTAGNSFIFLFFGCSLR